MLSRVANLPKFNSFIRQISKNVAVCKQIQIQRESEEATTPSGDTTTTTGNELKTSTTKQSIAKTIASNLNKATSVNVKTSTISSDANSRTQFTNNIKNQNTTKKIKNFDSNNNKSFDYQKGQQQQKSKNNRLKSPSSSSSYRNKNYQPTNENESANLKLTEISNARYREIYNKAIDSLNANINSFQNLIIPCQQLYELYELEPKVAENFLSDPIKTSVINALYKNLEKMNLDEFFQAVKFLLRFESNKIERLKPYLESNLNNFNIEQLVKIVMLLRSPSLLKGSGLSLARTYTDSIRDRLDEINTFGALKLAMKLFAQEPSMVKLLDTRLHKIADKLSVLDWVELLNTKSIIRQRNLSILELCAYNLIKNREQQQTPLLAIESIQKCLLSCGILNFHNGQFYNFLLDNLSSLIKAHERDANWCKFNENNLNSIINSIGILQLRDENLIDSLCLLLKNNSDQKKLLTSFVISCASVNYHPMRQVFKQLVDEIELKHFNLDDKKEKVNLINYVWSLCLLDCADSKMIATVLDKNFNSSLLKDKQSKETKSVLLKLLNINLHSMLLINNYEGPNLEDFNIEDYTQLLVPLKSPSFDTLVSTLSSFRSLEKYVKINLLTPYGILVDALMVVDKNGSPCQLSKHFSKQSTLETDDDEKKVAFKLINFKDQTLINKKLNGIIEFQIKLLKELDYNPLVIDSDELQSTNLVNRVNLIQSKLKQLTTN